MPIQLKRHLNRFNQWYPKGDPAIPAALFHVQPEAPDLSQINLPLPSKRGDYTCQAATRDGIAWYGANTGLTRWDPNARFEADKLMYFCARRDLPGNEILALLPAEPEDENVFEAIWVLTSKGAALLTMRWMTAEEKANHLLQESIDIVDRRGMFSQRWLSKPRDMSSKLPYNESDNDGCFGVGFAVGELMHYAVLRRELGPGHPETQRVKAIATRSAEAMLLLCYIPGRENGFVARTYLAPHEPIPNGYFFRKLGDGTAEVVNTPAAVERGVAGMRINAKGEVPARLARLYKDENLTDAGLVYKGDTSSDEITLHFLHFLYLNEILAEDDPELARLNIQACKNVMGHILDHGREMHDAFGGPTTWSKWSVRYFDGGLGWVDACLNSAELLMYLRVTMAVTGEAGRWQEAYDACLADGYAKLGPKHAERFEIMAQVEEFDLAESIMYGDHWLATTAFWPLIMLEPDEKLREIYRTGFRSWRPTICREHNPGYDIPFHLACPDEPLDWEKFERWFYRSPASRLAANVCLSDRHDTPKRMYRGGYKETGFLLPDDERFIAKYDRNPHEFRDWDDGDGTDRLVESCYVYTFAYWLGRYYNIIQ